jgi:hypothetical protein
MEVEMTTDTLRTTTADLTAAIEQVEPMDDDYQLIQRLKGRLNDIEARLKEPLTVATHLLGLLQEAQAENGTVAIPAELAGIIVQMLKRVFALEAESEAQS